MSSISGHRDVWTSSVKSATESAPPVPSSEEPARRRHDLAFGAAVWVPDRLLLHDNPFGHNAFGPAILSDSLGTPGTRNDTRLLQPPIGTGNWKMPMSTLLMLLFRCSSAGPAPSPWSCRASRRCPTTRTGSRCPFRSPRPRHAPSSRARWGRTSPHDAVHFVVDVDQHRRLVKSPRPPLSFGLPPVSTFAPLLTASSTCRHTMASAAVTIDPTSHE